jgi:hypothetical protein
MPINWLQITRTVWVAGLQQYRAVVLFKNDVWLARVEDPANDNIVYPASITFHALDGAKSWAELKLHELAGRSQ